ncbi:MAG TPA: RNA polymerase Rpb4 family protein [Methanospirillum sp.]|nr:RNA polymerase Rpb4 family protein [Methanospirillum sp.]
MKIKGIIKQDAITIPELKEDLLNVEAVRLEKGKEMSYELRRSIEHANQISRTSAGKSRNLVEALLLVDKVKPDVAYRIANTMPRTRDEVRAAFGKDKFAHTTEELDQIIDLVMTHFN